MRQSALALEGPPEKRFRGLDILLGAEQEIDSLSFFVDRAVKNSRLNDLSIGRACGEVQNCAPSAAICCIFQRERV